MNVQTNHTETSLNGLTLAVITKINNHFANMVGLKETKRFGTKPAAVKKCLANQAEFNKQFPPKTKETKTDKAPKSRFDMSAKLTCEGTNAKEGSIEWLIVRAITQTSGIVEDVVAQIVGEYERPRSEKNVDTAFAIRKIKRLIKKGKVTLNK